MAKSPTQTKPSSEVVQGVDQEVDLNQFIDTDDIDDDDIDVDELEA